MIPFTPNGNWSRLFLDLFAHTQNLILTLPWPLTLKPPPPFDSPLWKSLQKGSKSRPCVMNIDEFWWIWWILTNLFIKFMKIHQEEKKFSTSRKVRKSDELWWNSSKFVKFLVTNHRFITKNDELMNLMNWLVMNKVYIRQWWIKFVASIIN